MRAYLMIHFLTREGKSRGGGHEEGTRRERDPRKSGSPQSWSDQFHRGEALVRWGCLSRWRPVDKV